MDRVNANYHLSLLQITGAAVVSIAAMFMFMPSAYAGVVRAPLNTAEAQRSALCYGTQPYTIYGVTWINDTPTTSTGGDRWDENMSVSLNATTVDATLWTDAYNCPKSQGGKAVTGAQIFSLASAPGGQVDISFPYGTSVLRGDAKPGEFTDPPGKLRVRLDVTGKASGCYSVMYSGRYKDNNGKGASNTYTTSVCITRPVKQIPKSSLDGVKIDASGVSAAGSSAGYGGNSAGYPFSDDKVTVGGVTSSANPFYASNFTAGKQTVTITDAGTTDTGWQLKGYSICADGAGCTSAYLTKTANISAGSSFSFDFKADVTYHMRWIFEPQPSSLDGVKIDNSGLPGGSNAGYGGKCHGAGACADSLAAYPFSDDVVSVSDGTTSLASGGANYFNYSNFKAGTHTVSITDAGSASADTGWQLVGYSICSSGVSCTSAYLTKSANISGGASFSFVFQPGVAYHMRWIFEPTITATCTNPRLSTPDWPEYGESFTMTAIMSTDNRASSPRDSLTVKITNDAGTPFYSYGPAAQTYGYPVATPNLLTSTQPNTFPSGLPFGTYTVTTVLTGTNVIGSPVSCTGPINIIKKPYVHFFGLDVSAGGSFAIGYNKCLGIPTPPPYGIDAFVKGVGPLVRGSAVQYGALATGQISADGFGSASLRSTAPTLKDGLTFANNPPSPAALGKLGTTHCVPDYFNTKPAVTPQSITNPVKLTPLFSNPGNPLIPQQSWYGAVGGQTTINGFTGLGDGIADRNRVAIYVTGDVYITQDIRFKNTSWATPNDVPSFYLIAKGNIYISPSVSQLDGVYVAQGGTINTCAPGFSAYPAAILNNNCNSQLTVNGAFVAKKVNLYRTFASLINSQGGERPLGPGDCTVNASMVTRSGAYDCAAEVFNFSPETFLGQPALGSAPGSGITKYDFITSLSPVL